MIQPKLSHVDPPLSSRVYVVVVYLYIFLVDDRGFDRDAFLPIPAGSFPLQGLTQMSASSVTPCLIPSFLLLNMLSHTHHPQHLSALLPHLIIIHDPSPTPTPRHPSRTTSLRKPRERTGLWVPSPHVPVGERVPESQVGQVYLRTRIGRG